MTDPSPGAVRRRARTAPVFVVVAVLAVVAGVVAVLAPAGDKPTAVQGIASTSPSSLPGSAAATPTASGGPAAASSGAPAPTGRAPLPKPALEEVRVDTGLPSARASLNRLADTLTATPADDAVGRVEYVEEYQWAADTVVIDGRGSTILQPRVYRRWFAEDGSGRVETRAYRPGTAILAPGAHPAAVNVSTYLPGELPGAPVLPTYQGDIDTLILGGTHPENGVGDVIGAVVDLYRTRVPGKDTRSGILRHLAAADLDDRGHTRDKAGRDTLTVSVDTHPATTTAGGVRLMLRIDPSTGEVIGYDRIVLSNPGKLTGRFPQTHDLVLFLHRHRLDTTTATTPPVTTAVQR